MHYDLKEFSQTYLSQIILPFSEQMIFLMMEEIGLNYLSDPIEIGPIPPCGEGELSIGITLYLEPDMTILQRIPIPLAQRIGEAIFDEAFAAEDLESLGEVCREYLNILTGRALTDVTRLVRISPPFAVECVEKARGLDIVHVCVTTDRGVLTQAFFPAEILEG